jgi:RND superfamily putative drug exporter
MPFLGALLLAIVVYAVSFVVKSLRQPLPHRVAKPREHTFWYRWSRLVQHRPWPMLAAGVGILAILTIPLFSIRLGFGDTGNLP